MQIDEFDKFISLGVGLFLAVVGSSMALQVQVRSATGQVLFWCGAVAVSYAIIGLAKERMLKGWLLVFVVVTGVFLVFVAGLLAFRLLN